jgi:hypothetical protein
MLQTWSIYFYLLYGAFHCFINAGMKNDAMLENKVHPLQSLLGPSYAAHFIVLGQKAVALFYGKKFIDILSGSRLGTNWDNILL